MKKLGFTLAEVLITLVIIGVIAAMTVPTLMQNTNAQEYRTAFKKSISALNQALTLNYALDGVGANGFSSAKDLVDNVFKKRMSVMDTSTDLQWPTSSNGAASCSGSIFATQDGIIYCVTSFSNGSGAATDATTCDSLSTNPCGTEPNIYIDVNGAKKPNILTTSFSSPKDQYQASIYNQKVVPYGDAAQGVMYDAQNTGANAVTTS